jgi:hypothetical protein
MIQFRATSATSINPKRYDPGAFELFADLGLGEKITVFPGSTVIVSCGIQVGFFGDAKDLGLLVSLHASLGAFGMLMNTRMFRDGDDIVLGISNVGGKTAIHHGRAIAIATPVNIPPLAAKNVPLWRLT